MASLLLVVLLIHIVTYLINTIGASTIDNLLWHIYLTLPLPAGLGPSRTATQQRALKQEVLRLKREINATSSQDEFAKWAKLRRRHDKALEEFERLNKSLTNTKTSFDLTVKSVRWATTTGLKFFLQFYYSKQPMFALPQAWFPRHVEWVLSFPRAPMGTVSIQIWGAACAAVVGIVGEMVAWVAVLFKGRAESGKVEDSKSGKATVSGMKME